jgi:hypothetical protein
VKEVLFSMAVPTVAPVRYCLKEVHPVSIVGKTSFDHQIS